MHSIHVVLPNLERVTAHRVVCVVRYTRGRRCVQQMQPVLNPANLTSVGFGLATRDTGASRSPGHSILSM